MCCSQTFTCCIRIRSYICRIRSRNCTRSYRLTLRRRCALLPGQRSWQQVTGCTGYWRRIQPYIPASINCSCGSHRRQLLHWLCCPMERLKVYRHVHIGRIPIISRSSIIICISITGTAGSICRTRVHSCPAIIHTISTTTTTFIIIHILYSPFN